MKRDSDQNEEIISEEELENPGALVKKLREKLKICEKEKQDYLEGWQRTKADFVNSRKNSDKEKEDFIKFANQRLISEILPAIDNFESALRPTESKENSSEWEKGVENIYKELKKVLVQNGVEEISPTPNSDFDPNLHEAVALEKVDGPDKDHKIIAVFQKGYWLNDKVIKAAKVKVGEYNI